MWVLEGVWGWGRSGGGRLWEVESRKESQRHAKRTNLVVLSSGVQLGLVDCKVRALRKSASESVQVR